METLVNGINRPRVFVGMDKRLFAYSFVAMCVAFKVVEAVSGTLVGLGVAVVAFVIACRGAARLTTMDPKYLDILPRLWKQRAVYDVGRRDASRVVIEVK